MLRRGLVLFIFLVFVLSMVSATTYYLSPTGSDSSGDGSLESPWFTLNKAWSYVSAGDTIYMRGGTYEYNSRQILNGKSGTETNFINLFAYPGENPILTRGDSYVGQSYGIINLEGNYTHLKGLEFTNFTQIDGASWNPLFVWNANHNIFEELDVHDSGNGMRIIGHSSNNLIFNSDFHHNADPLTATPYENADGLQLAYIDSGSNNVVRGCRFWWNADDGIDLWLNEGFVTIENSWAWNNGFVPYTYDIAGNGNGFKLGMTDTASPTTLLRKVTNSVAFHNKRFGFNENGLQTNLEWYNNIAYQNCYGDYDDWCGGFHFTKSGIAPYIKNNIAYDNVNYNGAVRNADIADKTNTDHNSWDSSVSVSDADFLSVVPTGVDGPRNADGSLPNIDFLRLASSSDMIDKGIDVGLPYEGSAPDLGAYEYGIVQEIPSEEEPSLGEVPPVVEEIVSEVILNMPFEAGSNSTYTKDYSTFGNDGSVSGATWSSTFGHDGNGAYSFDGVNDYISLDSSLKVNLNSSTIGFWYKGDGNESQVILSRGFNAYYGLISLKENNHILLEGDTNNFVFVDMAVSSVNIFDNEWHFYALSSFWDSDKTIFSFYVDGNFEASTSSVNSDVFSINYIGSSGESSYYGTWINGSIDDVVIFNYPLNVDQINSIYLNGFDYFNISLDNSTIPEENNTEEPPIVYPIENNTEEPPVEEPTPEPVPEEPVSKPGKDKNTYVINDTVLNKGQAKKLLEGDTLVLDFVDLKKTVTIDSDSTISGNGVSDGNNYSDNYTLSNETHNLVVSKIGEDYVVVTVRSVPQVVAIDVGEEKLFELNGDNYFDLYVKLNSIEVDGADVTVMKVYQEMSSEEIEESSKLKSWGWINSFWFNYKDYWLWAIVGVAAILLFYFVFARSRR